MSATYTIRYAHATALAAKTTKSTIARRHPVAMLVVAPLAGLAFALAAPFAGLGLLAWMTMKALAVHRTAILAVAKRTALFFAAPFVGLAYLIAFPFVAIGMLLYSGLKPAAK